MVVLAIFVAGCGSDEARPSSTAPSNDPPVSTTTEAPPGTAPEMLTEDDDGATVSLEPGAELPVRLGNDWVWDLPQVTGTAIELVPVDYAQDPGFTEWMVETRDAGISNVSIFGEPNCGDAAACAERIVVFRFEVGG